MSFHELVLKFLEGVRDAGTRADITATLTYLVELYRAGRLSDERLLQALKELCLDVLMEKFPLKDIEELRTMAEEWAEQLYRAIRLQTIRNRYMRVFPSE